ncbi:putative integral membrane protein [Podospora conica]|nr:putative integral membrane protein [Schizothecium conicum]
MKRQRPELRGTIAPAIFSLLAFTLVLLIILAGVINHSLSQIHFLKVDISKLNVPAKLEDSTFLKDLSSSTGVDFVGEPATTTTLGLAETYTSSLLTACGHFANGNIQCSPANLGYYFNPVRILHLDSTSLEGTYTQALKDAIDATARTTRFLVYGYISSALLTFMAPLVAMATSTFAAAISSIATLLLLAVSIAGLVVFNRLSGAFNANFNDEGMFSSVPATPAAMSFAAFSISLLATSTLISRAQARSVAERRRQTAVYNVGVSEPFVSGGATKDGAAADPGIGSRDATKPGLWGRVQTFRQHKYTQIEKQGALTLPGPQSRVGSPGMRLLNPSEGERTPGLPTDRLRPDDDEDDSWVGRDDYVRSRSGSDAGRNEDAPVPMITLGGNKATLDKNLAYEPYSSTTRKGPVEETATAYDPYRGSSDLGTRAPYADKDAGDRWKLSATGGPMADAPYSDVDTSYKGEKGAGGKP